VKKKKRRKYAVAELLKHPPMDIVVAAALEDAAYAEAVTRQTHLAG
jgi:hypothetical protein